MYYEGERRTAAPRVVFFLARPCAEAIDVFRACREREIGMCDTTENSVKAYVAPTLPILLRAVAGCRLSRSLIVNPFLLS